MKKHPRIWQRIAACIFIFVGLLEWLYPDTFIGLSTNFVGVGVLFILFGLGLYALFSPSKSKNHASNHNHQDLNE